MPNNEHPSIPWTATVIPDGPAADQHPDAPSHVPTCHRISLDCRGGGKNQHIGIELPLNFTLTDVANALQHVLREVPQEWRNRDILTFTKPVGGSRELSPADLTILHDMGYEVSRAK